MNYSHLSVEERCCIRDYYKNGKSYREIAKLIGRNVSTISRELNRNFTHMKEVPTYYPHTAQKKYMYRSKGRNLARVSEKTLKKNLALINARPKKVLNNQTPTDLFEQELDKVLHLV